MNQPEVIVGSSQKEACIPLSLSVWAPRFVSANLMPIKTSEWFDVMQAGGLRALKIKNKTLLPVVQGGMGVGVSASSLASAVASLGGMGTISSVDLRCRHKDLMGWTNIYAFFPFCKNARTSSPNAICRLIACNTAACATVSQA